MVKSKFPITKFYSKTTFVFIAELVLFINVIYLYCVENPLFNSGDDISIYRENYILKLLNEEQFDRYCRLKLADQVMVCHLIGRGLDFEKAVQFMDLGK
jgi:hypothetical protein